MGTGFVAILVTCSSKREAERIAGALLAKHLIACANIISGVDSRFWWKGRIDRAKEVLMILKTKGDRFSAVEKEVRRIHSYDVPEIIALPIVRGTRGYLEWIDKSIVLHQGRTGP